MKKLNAFLTIMVAAGSGLLSVSAFSQEGAPWCDSGKPIRFAEPGWDSGKFETEVLRVIVERGYGCKTDLIVGAPPITLSALVNGKLEVWVEYWEGRTEMTEVAAKQGKIKVVGELVKGGGIEGMYVPEYVIKGDPARGILPMAPDLKELADVPRYKDVFKDNEDPSKGRFVNCVTGWACEKDNTQRMKAYHLNQTFNNFQPGTGASLDAAVASANQQGKAILFSYFEPSSLLGKYPSIRLQEPVWTADCWKTINQSTTDTPCGSASPSTNLAVAVSAAYADSDPTILAFFKRVQFSMQSVNTTIAEMAEKKQPARQVALEFLKNNQQLVKEWVPTDVAARVQSSL